MNTLNSKMAQLIHDLKQPHTVEQYKALELRFNELVRVYRAKRYGAF